MKRNIFFRAKDMNGNWVYGFYSKPNYLNVPVENNGFTETDFTETLVQNHTIGQLAGHYDEDEVVYEGDVLRVESDGVSPYDKYPVNMKGVVVYSDTDLAWYLQVLDDEARLTSVYHDLGTLIGRHCIYHDGNIHDHDGVFMMD